MCHYLQLIQHSQSTTVQFLHKLYYCCQHSTRLIYLTEQVKHFVMCKFICIIFSHIISSLYFHEYIRMSVIQTSINQTLQLTEHHPYNVIIPCADMKNCQTMSYGIFSYLDISIIQITLDPKLVWITDILLCFHTIKSTIICMKTLVATLMRNNRQIKSQCIESMLVYHVLLKLNSLLKILVTMYLCGY